MTTLVARPDRIRLAGQKQAAMATAQQRLMIVMLLFMAVISLIISRIIFFALFDTNSDRHTASAAFVPVRGDIVDRNNVPLARTIEAWSIRVTPEKIMSDKRALAANLADMFPDTSADEFYAKLTAAKPSYIRRRALPEQVSAVNALGEIAFDFPREHERLYPQQTLAAHVLGFTNMDGQGVIGMEAALEKQLIDKKARATPAVLSIDSRVQAALESELYTAMVGLEAQGAAGVILDARTSEVLAMSSLPVFNPNQIAGSPEEARKNAVTYNLYELGSTFKPLSIAAAIDDGVVKSMSQRYDATAPLPIAGFKIRDSHGLGRWINVPETLIHSSNIATARIADELGRVRLKAKYSALGFDQRPDIELIERAFPLWPRDWSRITNMTVSYGHGIAVTPLHLANAYAAMLNGGIYRPATLLKIEDGKIPQGRRVFKESTSARMRQLLRLIVTNGTGRSADAPGFRVGGKTGSAEKPSAGGYARHSVVATFASGFPMDNPRYIVLIMIDQPKGNAYSRGQRTAAFTAAPVVKNVVSRIGPMLGVIPDDNRDVDLSELKPLVGDTGGHD